MTARLTRSADIGKGDTSVCPDGDVDRLHALSGSQTCDVFVYGTLRHGEINDIAKAAARFGRPDIPAPRHIATGSVPGRLVDFGNWPGLLPDVATAQAADGQSRADVPARDVSTVIGDVFRIDVALLPILDEIEGIRLDGSRDAFYRSEVDVSVARWERGEALGGARRQSTEMQGGEDDAITPINAARAHETGALRCYIYPIDVRAGIGLPGIPGGDWIAYRLSRNG